MAGIDCLPFINFVLIRDSPDVGLRSKASEGYIFPWTMDAQWIASMSQCKKRRERKVGGNSGNNLGLKK
jgi:hypothetical protein